MTARSFTSMVVAAGAGYLLGTVPSASVAARLATRGRIDIRQAGTGNPGAANAISVLGRGWGYAVLAADITKSAAAGRLGARLAGGTGAHVAATAAVVGHCYPAWSGFKGGKGVACSVGQCLTTFPAYFPADLGVAALTATGPWRDRAFVATATASLAWVAAAIVWWRRDLPNLWAPKPSAALPIAAAVSSAVILGRFLSARR